MKTTFAFFISTISVYLLNAQVGVNPVAPTNDLDINSKLRVRTLPTQDISNSFIVTADPNGNIGKAASFILVDVGLKIATTNLNSTVTGQEVIDNLDLGMSLSITIPANKGAFVIITYSAPAGLSDFSDAYG